MELKLKHLATILIMVFFANFLQAQVPEGYTSQRIENVNFGTGVNHFTIEAATEGTGGEVQLRLDAADGPVIGHAFFHHTGSSNYFIDYECDLNRTVSGTHDVYMNILDYIDPVTNKVLNTRDFQFTFVDDSSVSNEDRLHIYPDVPGLDPSPYYNIEIQKVSELINVDNLADPSNVWQSAFAWFTESINDIGYYNAAKYYSQTYINFEMDSNTPIVVKITRKSSSEITNGAPSGPIESAAVVPVHGFDSWEVLDGAVYVTMSDPAQVVVDIDERMSGRTPNIPGGVRPYNNFRDASHSVTIFANPVIEDKPDPNDVANVYVVEAGKKIPDNLDQVPQSIIYFEPGIHKASVDDNLNERLWETGDIIPLGNNKSYYIPGNAIVYGNFKANNAENIRVFGHGVISGLKIMHWYYYRDIGDEGVGWNHRGIIMGTNAKNCHVEGVTMENGANHTMQCAGGGTQPSSITWVKVIGWRVNTDGFSVGGNIYVEDCFVRCQDDGLYTGGAKPMTRCIYWNDVHGMTFRGDNMSTIIKSDYSASLPQQLIVEDIDVVFAREVFGGPIIGVNGGKDNATLPGGTENTAQMVYFRNIKVSDPMPIKNLFGFDVKDKIGDYAGIRFENIEYNKYYNNWKEKFIGSPNAVLRNFVFDNVYISGEQMDLNLLNNSSIFDVQYVSNFTFRLRDTIAASGNVLIRTATNGTISIDTVPGSNQVTLTATPIDGFEFNGWSGDLSGKENPVTITVDRDMAITGNFDVFKYDIITSSDNGTITFDPPGGSYRPGTVVTVTAEGDLGYGFASWSGDLSGTEDSVTIAMDSDKYITANYKTIQTYNLNVDTKYGSVVLNPPGGTYNEGSQVTLTPNPDIGYIFGEWGGDLSGSTAPQTITMDGDKTVTAKFMYTGQGSAGLALNCGGPQYTAADDVVYEASSNGSKFSTDNLVAGTNDEVLYQTESFGGSLSYDFPLANGPYEVTLKFAEIFFSASGKRAFDVFIEDEKVLDNFDVFAEAGGKNIALDKTFAVTLLDGELNISLIKRVDNAKISAIQITNLPVDVEDHTLTASASNGSITIDPATGPYPAGSNVTLEAVPETGYAFLGWTGDFLSFENPAVLYMDGNKTVSAVFETIQTYSLTTSTTNGVLDVTPDKASYDPLEQVQLSVTPNAGYKFDGWQGDLSGTENPVTIYMNGDKDITANVVEIPSYTLSASGANGTVTVDPIKAAYLEGDQVTLTATANEGYRFSSWGGDLSGSVNPVTITMDSNIVITADFTLIPVYTLTTLASNGTITLDPAGGSYEEGTSVSVSLSVDEGYQFVGWSGDLAGTGNPITVYMNSDKNITAEITKIPTYTLSVQGENGTVTVDPLKAEYLEGDQVTITATADEGYHFDFWSGDLLGTTNPQTISVDSNISITAMFEVSSTYTLSISSTNGSVTLDPPGGSYDEGTVVNLTATPNSGYEFFAWGGDISGSSMNTSIIMTSNKSVIASFAPIASYTITTSATNGTIVLDPTGGSYTVGTVVTVKATPDEGYEFSNWSGDLSGNSIEETITVDGNKDISAIFSALTSIRDLSAEKEYSMHVSPNPFSTETTISYHLNKSEHVRITIYNMKGQKVNVLVDDTKKAGDHEVNWDASDNKGNKLNSGIYICKIEISSHSVQTRKLILKR